MFHVISFIGCLWQLVTPHRRMRVLTTVPNQRTSLSSTSFPVVESAAGSTLGKGRSLRKTWWSPSWNMFRVIWDKTSDIMRNNGSKWFGYGEIPKLILNRCCAFDWSTYTSRAVQHRIYSHVWQLKKYKVYIWLSLTYKSSLIK